LLMQALTTLFSLVVLILLIIFPVVDAASKRQCAPDSPHKKPLSAEKNGVLPYCKQYQSSSCCDPTEARAIQRTVAEMMRPECPKCFQMLQDWKCSECHPNAGKFYVNERSSIRLCLDYCKAFYDACMDIPFDEGRGVEDVFYLNPKKSKLTAGEWCSGNNIGPEDNCFRGIVPDLPNDDNCKCADHKCHLTRDKQPQQQTKNAGDREL